MSEPFEIDELQVGLTDDARQNLAACIAATPPEHPDHDKLSLVGDPAASSQPQPAPERADASGSREILDARTLLEIRRSRLAGGEIAICEAIIAGEPIGRQSGLWFRSMQAEFADQIAAAERGAA